MTVAGNSADGSGARAAAHIPAGYTPHDTERFVAETHSGLRSDFARDRARILHSSGLRRLAAKTQVLSPVSGEDFARTRLTHSLEVAQIGRELAASLGIAQDVVDGACLAHDLGHPPFGHNGEKALNEWMDAWGGFEGNAQTLRILVRLEPKIFTAAGESLGLNLTRASLDAACKYPWAREEASPGSNKFGYFAQDAEIFSWLREGSPAGRKCVEAQVMDLADDIAYSVHDFEDAVVGESIDPEMLTWERGNDALMRQVAEWSGMRFSPAELQEALSRLTQHATWLRRWDGSRQHQAQLKNFTSDMIGRFARAATAATLETYSVGSLARYGGKIVVPREVRAEIALLKGLVAAFVMQAGRRQPMYRRQRAVLIELAETLWEGAGSELEPAFRADYKAAANEADARRVIADQVASLTDKTAIAWYRKLCDTDLV